MDGEWEPNAGEAVTDGGNGGISANAAADALADVNAGEPNAASEGEREKSVGGGLCDAIKSWPRSDGVPCI